MFNDIDKSILTDQIPTTGNFFQKIFFRLAVIIDIVEKIEVHRYCYCATKMPYFQPISHIYICIYFS